jgi:ABC-2 type transport system permease protein
MRQILFLAQAEVLHIVRDRVLMAQTLIVPMIQLLVLANAATFEIRNTPIQIVDLDRSSTSRGVVNHLAANGHFDILDTTPSLDRADERLLDGTVTMVVVIPHDFEVSLVKTGVAPVELSVNAEKGSAAGIVQAYATRGRNMRGSCRPPESSGRWGPPSLSDRPSRSRKAVQVGSAAAITRR